MFPSILLLPLLFSLLTSATPAMKRFPINTSKQILRRDDCFSKDPEDTITDRMNNALSSGGDGFILSLCPNTEYRTTASINFASPNQEISTQGYPTDSSRAMIIVNGTVTNGTGHTTAIQGNCATCNNIKLRNIQIDGARGDIIAGGGANIEMGGATSGQLVEYVRSFNPRSWSCLHIAEGGLKCTNATVQNNDIGPCGTDDFQRWADGISFACANGIVRNNMVDNPTDGGIVLFGSPGTLVENNTIWIEEQTLLGGINLVDYSPWSGNYTGVVVQNNSIFGGFATDSDADSQSKGDDEFSAIVKIGIAIGPRTWFGDRYGNNKSENATVINNHLSGAFGYGMAISSAKNFVVMGNDLFGNTSFIGSRGPNCSSVDTTPSTQAFVINTNTTESSTTQSDFSVVSDGDNLICIQPPDGGDYWPYGGNPEEGTNQSEESTGPSVGSKVGLALGIIFGVLFAAVAAWFIRKWFINYQNRNKLGTTKGFLNGKF